MYKKEENSNIYLPYCHFCGGKVGEISDRTNEMITSIFDCEKCNYNYCNQCSYEAIEKNKQVQKYLRCDKIIFKIC